MKDEMKKFRRNMAIITPLIYLVIFGPIALTTEDNKAQTLVIGLSVVGCIISIVAIYLIPMLIDKRN